MDEKTTKYINTVISVLTRQRNEAIDLNTKLQAELALVKADLAEATKKEEKPKEEKPKEEKKDK